MALKPKQLELIEALLANPMIPDTVVADKIGINRNTVREWKRKEEFAAELKSRLMEQWADSERTAMETMQSLAREGDFKASKFILESLGHAPVQKVEASISNDININIE